MFVPFCTKPVFIHKSSTNSPNNKFCMYRLLMCCNSKVTTHQLGVRAQPACSIPTQSHFPLNYFPFAPMATLAAISLLQRLGSGFLPSRPCNAFAPIKKTSTNDQCLKAVNSSTISGSYREQFECPDSFVCKVSENHCFKVVTNV